MSRKPRLKDASFLTGMNPAAKQTPTAELISHELTATVVVATHKACQLHQQSATECLPTMLQGSSVLDQLLWQSITVAESGAKLGSAGEFGSDFG
ncbi:hypothetical protein D8911_12200 [Levilactobacillus brevis]|nr:hypothetical protein D8911_12200 [Levilactobacillus brevis]